METQNHLFLPLSSAFSMYVCVCVCVFFFSLCHLVVTHMLLSCISTMLCFSSFSFSYFFLLNVRRKDRRPNHMSPLSWMTNCVKPYRWCWRWRKAPETTQTNHVSNDESPWCLYEYVYMNEWIIFVTFFGENNTIWW